MPAGSYKRRVKTGQLTPAESERTARVANVVALAEYVWEDTEAARRRYPARCPPRRQREAVLLPEIEREWNANMRVYGADKV